MPNDAAESQGGRIRGKTVYLLGAGFSVGSGAPLLGSFIPDGLDLLKATAADATDRKESKRLLALAKKVEQTLWKYVAAAEFLPDRLVNLEDLFCLVDLRKQYAPNPDKPKNHETTLKQFVVEVLELAWKKHTAGWEDLIDVGQKRLGKRGTTMEDNLSKSKAPPVVLQRSVFDFKGRKTADTDQFYNACAYQAFLSKILHANDNKKNPRNQRSADYVITLNYDLVIERKLAKISDRSVYYGKLHEKGPGIVGPEVKDVSPRLTSKWPKRGPAPLPLLKIHGSVNWLTAADGADTSASTAVEGFWNPSAMTKSRDKKIGRIPIIPPTWRKTAATNTVFARLLGEALRHMKLADKIVIVGYSLPTTDTYFRYLLAEALGTPILPQIELWDVIEPAKLSEKITLALGDRIKRAARVASEKQKGFLELVSSYHIPNPIEP